MGLVSSTCARKKDLSQLSTWLDDTSKHIEFRGFLTNHEKHAVIALHGLGASAEHIREYVKNYEDDNPYGAQLEPARKSEGKIDAGNWKDFVGRKKHFPDYVEFFAAEEKRMGMHKMLQVYLPELMEGPAAALLHGLIHTGWALDARNRTMEIEGLAYLAFANVSCVPPETAPPALEDATPLDTLLRISKVGKLEEWVLKVIDKEQYDPKKGSFHPELEGTGLQLRVACLLAEGHPLIHGRPRWVDLMKIDDMLHQMYYALSILYLAVPGDFVLLHALTGMWGLEHIVKNLDDEKAKRNAIAHTWAAIVATALGNTLGLFYKSGDKIPGFPSEEALQKLHDTYEAKVDGKEDGKALADGKPWPVLFKEAMVDREEHNPKLVYVMHRLWLRSNKQAVFRMAASHFTETPKVSK